MLTGVLDALDLDIGELLAIGHNEARLKEMELVGESIRLERVKCVVTVWYRLYTLHQRTIYEQSTRILL